MQIESIFDGWATVGDGENRPSKSAHGTHTHRFVMGRGRFHWRIYQNCPNPVRASQKARITPNYVRNSGGVDSVWILDTVCECVLGLCSCVEWIYTNVAWNASGDHKFTWFWAVCVLGIIRNQTECVRSGALGKSVSSIRVWIPLPSSNNFSKSTMRSLPH